MFFGLGNALRTLRETAGLTPQQVGQQTGLDPGRLSRWERETSPNLDVDALGRLLEAYGVDVCALGHLLRAGAEPAVPERAGDAFSASPPAQRLRDGRVEEAVRSLVADALKGIRATKI
jgi:transcriptional regulator with XRE-family HTH domain